ncbi:MAG: ATP-binding protein [Planctomycetota bacterium JB042]
MGIYNPADGSVHLKVVYYGPARGGKTTNLEQVRHILDPEGESALLSVSTGEDTTLFFDHLPLELSLLGRHRVRVQGFTVPGQVRFDRTRRLVLQGCDGVVFVADSAPDRIDENVESLKNLVENLRRNGLDPERVPIVLQANKRDLADAVPIEALDRALELTGRPCHLATALTGDGVYETFRDILLGAMEKAHEEFGLARYGLRRSDTLEAMEEVLARRRRFRVAETPRPRRILEPAAEDAPAQGALLDAAVRTSVELAELVGAVTAERNAARRAGGRAVETSETLLHDLRKPVTALTSTIWLLRRRATEGKGGLDCEELAVAEGALAELSALLDDGAARLQDDEERGEETVDLDDLVAEALRHRALEAREAGVQLRALGRLGRVRGHRATLSSLVSNLVDNAVKYRSPRRDVGHVRVIGRPQRDGGTALLVVDDGIGIPEADRDAVFRKHHRARNVAAVEGSGLGLHLVRSVAHAHDARIGLRSTPGVGTLVRVRFPACRVAAAEEEGAVSSAAAAGSAGPACSPPPAPGPPARSSVRTGSS